MKALRVLVVEDEKPLADGIAQYLSCEDSEVEVAYTFSDALHTLEDHPVDVVISDVRLPDGDGLALMEWAKELHPETEFVIMTGFGDTQMERYARKIGGLRFFHKPVDLSLLKDLVTYLAQKLIEGGEEYIQIPDVPGTLSDKKAEELQRAYLTGDESALDAILLGFRKLIFSVACKWYKLSPEDAEDIYQDVAIEVMTKISRIRNLRTFIVGTTMNLCKKHLERGQRTVSLPPNPDFLYTKRITAEERVYREEVQEILQNAMERLDPKYRSLLEMLFDENISYKEISEKLGIPMGSIGPTRQKALKKLRQMVHLN